MPSSIILKALGLNKSPNQLDVQDGSLTIAKNVIIQRDNVIQSRRGLKLYGDSFGTSTDTLKQLISYRDRIIRHFQSTLQFDNNGAGSYSNFAGSYTEPEDGIRIKSIEANGNLYFTTSEGIKKISASSAEELSTDNGYITQAGGLKALDISADLKITLGDQSSFFTQDGIIAYRVVWNLIDANNQLVPGSPSQRVEISNPLLNLLLLDFDNVLNALDNVSNAGSSLISDANYVSTLNLSNTTTATTLRTNLISLASKIDNDILYADVGGPAPLDMTASNYSITGSVATINFSAGTATDYFVQGSKIYISNIDSLVNGAQTVLTVGASSLTCTAAAGTVGSTAIPGAATINSNEYRSITQPSVPSSPTTNQELVELQDYLSSIILRLQVENSFVISTLSQTTFISPLDITTTASTIINITIPTGATLNNFYQIYRSDQATATGTTVLADLFPNDEMQLVYEAYVTQNELDEGLVVVEDVVLDAFRGANLYTNPDSGEGILQANDLPPFAKDINRFKNVIFYANTRTRHRLNEALLGVSNMIADHNNGDIPAIVITNTQKSYTYTFRTGVMQVSTITTDAGSTLNNSGTSDYFLINSANNENLYYVWYQVGTSTDPTVSGRTGIPIYVSAGDTANQIATKTRNTLSIYIDKFSISGSTNNVIITNIKAGYTDEIDGGTISGGSWTFTTTTPGRGEKASKEQTELNFVAGSLFTNSGPGDYFNLNTAFNKDQYYVWYQVGTSSDPMISGKIGIQVNILASDTAAQVASKTQIELDALEQKFTTDLNSAILTVTNYYYGPTNNANIGNMPVGFTITVLEEGLLQILLSTSVSPATAVDETAKSLVRIINKNFDDLTNTFYLSGAQDVPGKILFEAKSLDNELFYILGNNANTGNSFNPAISPEHFITNISVANPSVITSNNHGLVNGDEIVIVNSDSVPSIDGVYAVTVINANSFSIPVNVTNSGTEGSFIISTDASYSDNEVKSNRIYYSKFQQPEAVPILNYLDVGAENKAILRIFPLRDSLFIFKEDGLYRLSGESAPFTVDLFDGTVSLLAPDTIAATNNLIFCWTDQGINFVSEAGVDLASRPIDVDILPLVTYSNFRTATWAIGYESDNAYIVFTVNKNTDEHATIGYRYSTLTQTWTTIDITATCGLVFNVDDKLYLGAGDVNSMEQERKDFSRTDYADREFDLTLTNGNYLQNGTVLKFTSVDDIAIGDSIFQSQLISIYDFNALLQKLDLDTGINDTNYYSLLVASGGDDLRDKIANSDPTLGLAAKLDADLGVSDTDYLDTVAQKTGSITSNSIATQTVITTSAPHELITGRVVTISGVSGSSPSINNDYVVTVLSPTTFSIDVNVTIGGTGGTFTTVNADFRDIKACYNGIINKLNNDSGVNFNNYNQVNNNINQEVLVTNVNRNTKQVTVNISVPFIVGDVTVFKAIESILQYTPNTMGDPLGYKHLREATVMFETKTFTNATLSFATDLFPAFTNVTIPGLGNGIFGNDLFGDNFFGGMANSVPFRTLIPRNSQRCRYIVVKFSHKNAREKYSIFGISLTGEIGQSTRAYR